MSLCCPDCGEPVDVKPNAREGRCADCRPQPKRAHSEKRMDAASSLMKFVYQHSQRTP